MTNKELSKEVKGGLARAKSMTAEQRSTASRLAAQARWNPSLPRATHDGELVIGNVSIPCAVLQDGTRVLSERGVTKALGGKRGGAHWRRKKANEGDGANLPVYLSANNIFPFISMELRSALISPIQYITKSGGQIGNGVPADCLAEICEVWLKARHAGVLHQTQQHLATQAEALMRSFAKLGITALVDEATGYQEVRDKSALRAILDKYLRKELAAWAKQFPDEFYKEIFRLRRWEWKGMRVNRPQCVANYTRDIVYERLAPRILEELERKNPVGENGSRKAKHHQWLTMDVGHPALAQHLHSSIALMRASDSWDQFKRMLDRSLPKRGDTLLLPMDID